MRIIITLLLLAISIPASALGLDCVGVDKYGNNVRLIIFNQYQKVNINNLNYILHKHRQGYMTDYYINRDRKPTYGFIAFNQKGGIDFSEHVVNSEGIDYKQHFVSNDLVINALSLVCHKTLFD